MRLTGLRSGVGRAAFLPEAPGLTLFLPFPASRVTCVPELVAPSSVFKASDLGQIPCTTSLGSLPASLTQAEEDLGIFWGHTGHPGSAPYFKVS